MKRVPKAPTLPELTEPYWLEVVVPDPATKQRAVLCTFPFTPEGILAAVAHLQSMSQWKIDEVKKQLAGKRANP